MRLTTLAIGTRMPAWVTKGVAEYQKRLPRHVALEFRELPPASRRSGSTAEKIKEQEADALLKALDDNCYTIALDERGALWSSQELSVQMDGWLANQPRVAFIIGGADGLSERIREKADRVWSLSPLTLPHALVRVVLAEQIYRAWTLLQGHPYHRD